MSENKYTKDKLEKIKKRLEQQSPLSATMKEINNCEREGVNDDLNLPLALHNECIFAGLSLGITKQPEKCEVCGSRENVTFAPRPFAADMYGDETCCWMCEGCRYESAMDI